MDLSAVIFVVVAVAWAAFLIPKAVRGSEDGPAFSLERVSETMRVLVRRGGSDSDSADGAGDADDAPAPHAASPEAAIAPSRAERAAAPTPAQLRARRASARRALQRRRRVFAVLLGLNVVVAAVAAFAVISWWYVAAPVTLLAAWLVTCRMMVKDERAAWQRLTAPPVIEVESAPSVAAPNAASPESAFEIDAVSRQPADYLVEQADGFDVVGAEAETSVFAAAVVDDRDPATLWSPRAVPLPTYVGKDHAAARELPAFDFDDSGVWTSGHDAADSELVRRSAAEQAERDQAPHRRAVGH